MLVFSTLRFLHVAWVKNFCAVSRGSQITPWFDPITTRFEKLHNPDYQHVPFSGRGREKQLLHHGGEGARLPSWFDPITTRFENLHNPDYQHVPFSERGRAKNSCISTMIQPDYPLDLTKTLANSKICTILIISTFHILHVVGKNNFSISAVKEPGYPVIWPNHYQIRKSAQS